MSGVSVNQLSIRFGANEVIRNLDLQVEDGEFLVLLGPSGCGKSTLLHSIAGLVDVASGEIRIGGEDMTDAEPADRGIGMVFQSYALYPTMTVERNMSFGLRVAGLPKAEITRRVSRAAQMLQLEPLLQRKPSQLSGGNGNVWPSAAPWCARRVCSCWMSRCPTWTRSCAPSCAVN